LKLGRKEPDIEGVAIHGGPESCVGVCEDVGEALIGVHVGWAIVPRNPWFRGADAVAKCGRQHRRQRYRELSPDPARSVNLCMRGSLMGENGEIPWLPVLVVDAPSRVVRGVAGRPVAGGEGNAEAVIPR
jgi:hypothetical protein